MIIYKVVLTFRNGRFYATDVKYRLMNLTSQTLKSSGMKKGRVKLDGETYKNTLYTKKELNIAKSIRRLSNLIVETVSYVLPVFILDDFTL